MRDLIDRARTRGPIRLAVVGAGQGLVLDGLQQAKSLGLVEPCLIGNAREIADIAEEYGWDPKTACIAAAAGESEQAAAGARHIREGRVDAIMKGKIHTDVLMRALLHETAGLRIPGRRASHVLIAEMASYPKLLCITDAALNIAPNLDAKAQILENAAETMRVIGIEIAKAAVLSAVETVRSDITSSLDAAALAMMAQRKQIPGVLVDGPLAFDNAVSAAAAKEKGIATELAGDVDILLVPDLVSGNILMKALEYFAGATLAGAVVGLTAPVILTSRADPAESRVASIALAVLLHKSDALKSPAARSGQDSGSHLAPQPEMACSPLPM